MIRYQFVCVPSVIHIFLQCLINPLSKLYYFGYNKTGSKTPVGTRSNLKYDWKGPQAWQTKINQVQFNQMEHNKEHQTRCLRGLHVGYLIVPKFCIFTKY